MRIRKYHVYIIELDKEFALTRKAREANPQQNLDKPCIYIGSSSKTPEERFREHMIGARNSRGPLFSRVVYMWGKCLLPKEYTKYNPIDTREEALEMAPAPGVRPNAFLCYYALTQRSGVNTQRTFAKGRQGGGRGGGCVRYDKP